MTYQQSFQITVGIPSGASASLALTSGQTVTFDAASGTELQPYTDPQGQFTQRCIKVTNAAIPNFRAYYRPDVSGGREEWVFELSDTNAPSRPIASITAGNPTIITTTIAHGYSTGFLINTQGWTYTKRNTDGSLSNVSLSYLSSYAITVISPTSFSIAIDSTLGATKGSTAVVYSFDLPGYTATITPASGGSVITKVVPFHYQFCRWRWFSARRPVRTNYAALVAANLIPPISTAAPLTYPSPSSPVSAYTPMTYSGNGGPDQGAGGVDPITGLITGWQADYLLGRYNTLSDPEQSWRDQAEADGTLQMTLRDTSTEAFIDFSTTANLKICVSPGGEAGATKFIYRTKRNTPDSGHFPSAAYVPFLLTGDPYYLEQLQISAIYHPAFSPNSAPPTSRYSSAGRYYAWPLRAAGQAYAATPASVPNWICSKTYMKYLLDTARSKAASLEASTDNNFDVFHSFQEAGQGGAPDLGKSGDHIWQHSYISITQAWLAKIYPTEWKAHAEWQLASEVNRTSATSGWRRDHIAPYQLRTQCCSAIAVSMTTTSTTMVLQWKDLFNPGDVVSIQGPSGTESGVTLVSTSDGGTTWTVTRGASPKAFTASTSSTGIVGVFGRQYASWAEAGIGNALVYGWGTNTDSLAAGQDLTYPALVRGALGCALWAGLGNTGLQASYDWLQGQFTTYWPVKQSCSAQANWSVVPS